jgi:hypothetical protein
MPQDILEFVTSQQDKKNYIINQLFSTDSSYGIIAGRTGLGKTNMMLNLAFWLGKGEPFFKLQVQKRKVLYRAFEGGEENLKERCLRIMIRTGFPEKDWLQIERVEPFVLLEKGNVDKFKKMIEPFDIVLLDPIKWMVGANYTQPDRVADFTKTLTKTLHQDGKTAILSMQIRKRDTRVKIEPGDLFELKGAADYVEDAAFAVLLERSELRGKNVAAQLKDRHLTLYFAKHREATRDLEPVELFYEYDTCEFKVV